VAVGQPAGVAKLSARPTPYTGAAKRRQILRPLAFIAAAVLAASLAGCSTFSLPFGPDAPRVSMETTAAIPARGASIESVDPSDWAAVGRAIASIPASEARTLDWNNPGTRSTGSVTVTPTASAKAIAACRTFATTVSDSHGIRRYRGEACREIGGRWQLKGVSADDVSLS
jgi:surface antigen